MFDRIKGVYELINKIWELILLNNRKFLRKFLLDLEFFHLLLNFLYLIFVFIRTLGRHRKELLLGSHFSVFYLVWLLIEIRINRSFLIRYFNNHSLFLLNYGDLFLFLYSLETIIVIFFLLANLNLLTLFSILFFSVDII